MNTWQVAYLRAAANPCMTSPALLPRKCSPSTVRGEFRSVIACPQINQKYYLALHLAARSPNHRCAHTIKKSILTLKTNKYHNTHLDVALLCIVMGDCKFNWLVKGMIHLWESHNSTTDCINPNYRPKKLISYIEIIVLLQYSSQ
jgi:hypothetical protein